MDQGGNVELPAGKYPTPGMAPSGGRPLKNKAVTCDMNIRISGLSTKSRREFLRSAGIAAAADLVPRVLPASRIFTPAAAAYKYPNPGKIVIVHHPHAVIGANNDLPRGSR